MSSTLIRDGNNSVVQALFPQSAVTVALSGTSQELAIPAGTTFLRVAATGNVWIAFGAGSATATTSSILFPGGVEVFPIPLDITHMAVLQVGASAGYVSINRMK
jgi:hypothetical protein